MLWLRIVAAVGRRPDLWPTACRQVVRLAPPAWWRSRPGLPIPTDRYLRFRTLTQYGDENHAPDPSDVMSYLTWCRDFAKLSGKIRG
jgi:hypothetical protein